MTASLAKIHIYEKYSDYLHIFTDGSLMENTAGASFSIPSMKINRSFYIGESFSIFTAELVGILQALKFLLNIRPSCHNLILLVDSKSALYAIKSVSLKTRPDLITDISLTLHSLISNSYNVCLSWIPSHVGIIGNESADKFAKKGVDHSEDSSDIVIPISTSETFNLLEKIMWQRLRDRSESKYKKVIPKFFSLNSVSSTPSIYASRSILSIFFRIHLNSIKTKFSKNALCICRTPFSLSHSLFFCQRLIPYLPPTFIAQKFKEEDLQKILLDIDLVYSIASSLYHSPIHQLI